MFKNYDLDKDLFLHEDLWIRKRFSELLCNETTLYARDCCKRTLLEWNRYKSQVSRFLWRIKPDVIITMKNWKGTFYIKHWSINKYLIES